MTRSRPHCGFALIELMIVIAIIGILSSVAAGSYVHFVTRAKISEGLVLVGPVKVAVAEYLALNGEMPQGSNWLSLLRQLGSPVRTATGAGSGEYVSRIWWNNSAQEIRICYDFFPISGSAMALRATVNERGGVRWQCGAPADGIAVPERYLPASCRG